MNAVSPAFQSPRPHEVADELSAPHRTALIGLVVVAHVAAWVGGTYWPASVPVQEGAPPISVTLISDEPVAAAAPPTPAAEAPADLVRPAPPVTRPVAPPPLATKARTPQEATVAPPPPPKPAQDVPAPAPAAEAAPPAPVAANPAPAAAMQPGPATQATAQPPAPRLLPSSAVRYLVPPTLAYPRISRDLGESGTVRLKVLVDEQGRPREVSLAQSSGYGRLDQAAMQAMRAARFQPHLEDGVARSVWVVAPLTFQLEES